jgi:uncharacterized protein (TIGR00730 family)
MKKRLCVFCGASSGNNPVYMEMARELGMLLAKNNIGLVYGGATIGVMGAIADSVLAHGGEVIGVMPEHLVNYEIAHNKLTEMHVVPDMHTRKKLMYDKSDYFLTLPGGMGTLDEMFEILTWSQLKLHQKPCYIFNYNNFYDSLLSHLSRIHEEGFMKREHLELLSVVNSFEEIANFF